MRELMRRDLAEQHRAGIVELAGRRGILRGNVVRAHLGMARGEDAARVVDVLQSERDAVQRTAIAPLRDFLLRHARLLQRQIGRHRDKGVQLRIEGRDALEVRMHELHGRELARADPLRQLRDGGKMQFVSHGESAGTRSTDS